MSLHRAAAICLALTLMCLMPALEVADLAAQDAASAPAASDPVTASDYARAERLLGFNAEKLAAGYEVEPRWLDGDRFWYRNRTGHGHEFVLVDPGAATRRPAFDHARLAAALSVAADTAYEPSKLPFDEFFLADGGRAIRFEVDDSVAWTCDISDYTCAGPDSATAGPPIDEVRSPDGRWIAFERDADLWVRSVETGEETALTTDGEPHYGYAIHAEGCCTVITDRKRGEKHRPILRWSPDSRRIVTLRLDEREVEQLHILETKEGRPELHSYRYALPGDSIVPTWELFVFDVPSGERVRVELEAQVMGFGALEQDTIWADVRWSPAGDEVFFVARDRDQRRVRLLAADAVTGAVREVVEERGPTFVELNLGSRSIPNWRVVSGGGEVVWFSERDGWGHLYLYDARTGAVKNRITEGPWVVVDLLHVDDRGRRVWFTAAGREPGLDIYHRQLYRASLDGGGIERLTPEDADHEVAATPSGRWFVDTWSTRDTIPVTVLRDRDGRVVRQLEEADISRLVEAGWRPPEHFVVKARDGVTDLHGFLYFPSDFDPEERYPIIDYIYPGPQIGPIGWRNFRPDARGNPHALAELGFIVFTIDATGTPFRHKAFHDVWYGDMGDNGLLDHVVAMRQLAGRYPQIDLDRVGIYGHSGGGFSSTGAILRFPDFFKVAVSSAGNHDNRSYYYRWGEKYQGPLVRDEEGGDNFESQANHLLADRLEGKLLLMYGSMDDNVHPNATLLLIDELIEANKDFDLIVLPNRNHGFFYEPYVVRRTWDYFVEHLKGVEPPREYRIREPDAP
jgi:dipeptidyl aminopeptidase/acylaminoacyl peptidase